MVDCQIHATAFESADVGRPDPTGHSLLQRPELSPLLDGLAGTGTAVDCPAPRGPVSARERTQCQGLFGVVGLNRNTFRSVRCRNSREYLAQGAVRLQPSKEVSLVADKSPDVAGKLRPPLNRR